MRVLVSNYTARRRACRHFRRISDLNAEGLRDALRRSLRYLFEAMGRQLPAPLRTFSEVSAGRSVGIPRIPHVTRSSPTESKRLFGLDQN